MKMTNNTLSAEELGLQVIKNIQDMINLPPGESLSSSTPLVMKKVDVEEQRILGVVLEPNVFDLHQDIYNEIEVALACKCFNEQCMKPNIQHLFNVPGGEVVIEKSFIQPIDCMIADKVVKAGTWLQQWKIHDPSLWEMVKDGDFTGFSVGCHAIYEDLE